MKTFVVRTLAGLGILAGTMGVANAALFDNSTGPAEVATVGTGGDYTTFEAACTAFNAVAGGINRPWEMRILEDLSVASSAIPSLANTFGVDGSLTIKPAPATTPKITFSYTTPSPAGFFGLFVIGSNSIALAPATDADIPDTDGKYIIDGSNTPGGTTRDLTLIAGESTALASNLNRLVRVVGRTRGVVIKNTVLTYNDTAGSIEVIGLGAGTVGSTNFSPDNLTIQNCSINSGIITGTSANSFGIGTSTTSNGTLPTGTAIQGLVVEDCDFTIKQRGIFMNGVGNATISGNTITHPSTAPAGVIVTSIFHNSSNSATGWTQSYTGNTISIQSPNSTAGQGIIGIYVEGAPTTGNYAINNNIILGNFLTSGTAHDGLCRAMALGSATSNFVVEHNTVLMPANAANGTTANRAGCIVLPSTLTTGSAVLRNNFLRMAEVDGLSAAISSAGTTALTSTGNTLFAAASGRVGRAGATGYALLTDWQGAGYDLPGSGAQSVDLTATSPSAIDIGTGKWAGTGQPTGVVVTFSSTVLTDIDGDPRVSGIAYPGADEFAAFPLPVELDTYSVE